MNVVSYATLKVNIAVPGDEVDESSSPMSTAVRSTPTDLGSPGDVTTAVQQLPPKFKTNPSLNNLTQSNSKISKTHSINEPSTKQTENSSNFSSIPSKVSKTPQNNSSYQKMRSPNQSPPISNSLSFSSHSVGIFQRNMALRSPTENYGYLSHSKSQEVFDHIEKEYRTSQRQSRTSYQGKHALVNSINTKARASINSQTISRNSFVVEHNGLPLSTNLPNTRALEETSFTSFEQRKPILLMYPRKEIITHSISNKKFIESNSSLELRKANIVVASQDSIDKESSLFETEHHDSSFVQNRLEINESKGFEFGKLASTDEYAENVKSVNFKTTESAGFANNQEYYEYLMLAQRHASSNFIHKIDSSEIVWMDDKNKTKFVGPFLIGDVIGKGSFGKVKEGLCSNTLQRVAAKIINKKRVRKTTGGGGEIVTREIKLLRKLRHENVVKLVDVYCKVEDKQNNIGIFNWFSTIEEELISWVKDDGSDLECNVNVLKWYLVFEYCPCTLQSILDRDGKIEPNLAQNYFGQIAKGVDYIHSQSVIHRDIKPGNILVTTDGIIKLSDFGIAEIYDQFDGSPMNSSEFSGTHQFLPPELADGEYQFCGIKVDVWALGVTLFYMLTGSFPFDFNNEGNLLLLYETIVSGIFQIPASVDEACHSLLNGMLKKDAKERFSLAEIIGHSWTKSSTKVVKPILLYVESQITDDKNDYLKDVDSTSPEGEKAEKTQQSNSEESKSDSRLELIQIETTMIPYIESLYSAEIEESLKKMGSLRSMSKPLNVEDVEMTESSPKKNKMKRILRIFSKKKNERERGSSESSTPLTHKSSKSFKMDK